MNRNVVFGAGLAVITVAATLVLTGGTPPPTAPSQAPVQGTRLPSLTPMMEADAPAAPAKANSASAPSHH